jgi:hypothetical protein
MVTRNKIIEQVVDVRNLDKRVDLTSVWLRNHPFMGTIKQKRTFLQYNFII